jgi:hypothetical protein
LREKGNAGTGANAQATGIAGQNTARLSQVTLPPVALEETDALGTPITIAFDVAVP